MPAGHIRSFLLSKAVCTESCYPTSVYQDHQERDGSCSYTCPGFRDTPFTEGGGRTNNMGLSAEEIQERLSET